MSDIDLAAIRARAEAATPGPWDLVWDGQTLEVLGAGAIAGGGDVPVAEWLYPVSTTPPWRDERRAECDTADAEFIAHAREDVPALLAEVENLRNLASDFEDQRDKARAERAEYHYARGLAAGRMEAEAERDRLRTELDEVGQRSADRMVENHRLSEALDAVRALADDYEAHKNNLPLLVPASVVCAIRTALDEHLGGTQ